MPHEIIEFECSSCQKIFDIKLNTSLNGNYRIHCPNCNHVHYRKVINGQITDTRFPQNDCQILIEDIRPMKSCCRDIRKETIKDFSQDFSGFIHRLWKEKFSYKLE